MNLMHVYDTETTGLPDWHAPSGGEQQPHIVQLGTLLVDTDTREIVDSLDVIIRPNGWDIPQEVVDIHGITTERAMDEGIPEEEALERFMALHDRCAFRLGHVQSFDARIIRIALKRYRDDVAADLWKEAPAECTAKMAKPLMSVTSRRMPKLREAYEHFMGHPMPDAHSAMGDVNATLAIYWAMKGVSDGASL